jgi:hypothetical protein
MCRWCATYSWKALKKGYNLATETSLQAKVYATKLWGPKVVGLPTLGISGLSNGSLGTKCHLDVAPMKRCIIYCKGEGGGFPQVWAVVSLVSPSLPVVRLNTKSVQIMH